MLAIIGPQDKSVSGVAAPSGFADRRILGSEIAHEAEDEESERVEQLLPDQRAEQPPKKCRIVPIKTEISVCCFSSCLRAISSGLRTSPQSAASAACLLPRIGRPPLGVQPGCAWCAYGCFPSKSAALFYGLALRTRNSNGDSHTASSSQSESLG